jgi:hypothetical protein
LTHIPPSKVYEAASEISRVSNSVVMLIERYFFKHEHSHQNRWSHDLVEIFKDFGWLPYEYSECNAQNHTKVLVLLKEEDKRLNR